MSVSLRSTRHFKRGTRFIMNRRDAHVLVFVRRTRRRKDVVARIEDTGEEVKLPRDAWADDVLDPSPVVGMGATLHWWTDRTACTITEVRRNGKQIVIQEDRATLLNGFDSGEPDALAFTPGGFFGHTSGRQRYRYERNPEGRTWTASLRKEHVWKVRDADGGMRVSVGRRSEYYDYNF